MALRIDSTLTAVSLRPAVERLFEYSAPKLLALEKRWPADGGAPVFTVAGRYGARGWTEWTQGFQFGSLLLQYEATGERRFLELGRSRTLERMAVHVTHMGVHDHGFNNVSTYGNLRRLMREGRMEENERELQLYELALKVSGAVQAARWTELPGGGGYIYSFNGPHSLFVDTIRSLRSLALGHQLGHVLMGERDCRISLLDRLLRHAVATARFNVFQGEGRDAYDERGRTAHEAIFNLNDGSYRCPSSQQGYSPFTTWTRGLAWAVLGFAEQLQFLESLRAGAFDGVGGEATRDRAVSELRQAALATANFYLQHSCTDGVPLWDTGAPQAHRLGDYLAVASQPFNRWEPVDSSAAAIAAQGLIRLGRWLAGRERRAAGARYIQAGLTVARTLLSEPYVSTRVAHEGLLLHSVYHRPNGWDHVATGQRVPNGESSMWGDYHLRELALQILREARAEPELVFFDSAAAAPGKQRAQPSPRLRRRVQHP